MTRPRLTTPDPVQVHTTSVPVPEESGDEQERQPASEAVPAVRALFAREHVAQHTAEWHAKRKRMLTASDVATVLNQNPYRSRRQLLLQKLGFQNSNEHGNFCTSWGTKHEDMALQRYCQLYGQKANLFGLLTHRTLPWLGASPDGVTDTGLLVEIKCPVVREIKPEVPHYYMAQLQVLMEVLDLEEAHFVQFRPEGTWNAEELEVQHVPRSRAWFSHHLPALQAFVDEWTHLQAGMQDSAELKQRLHEEYLLAVPDKPSGKRAAHTGMPRPRLKPRFDSCPLQKSPEATEDPEATEARSQKCDAT